MPRRVILVAVEDSATARAVAAAAGHIAMSRAATEVILLHVLNDHTLANAVFTMVPLAMPLVESTEEGERVLALAEAALRNAYAARGKVNLRVTPMLRTGPVGQALTEVAAESGATIIVIGARRPHAFGRLVHPDVRSYLEQHTGVAVQVVPLLLDPPSLSAAGPSAPG